MGYFLSITLTFFLVMDALGTIPTYLSVLDSLEEKKRKSVAFREIGISLVMLFIYFFVGDIIIKSLNVYHLTVEVSGGVVLFVIASRFIFMSEDESTRWEPGAHLIVPIATPIIASPSVFAALMIYAESPVPNSEVILAMIIAWAVSAFIYLFARPIRKVMKDVGLLAIQRFMGLLVALIAIQKVLHGLTEILGK